jgi:hypothetical protein
VFGDAESPRHDARQQLMTATSQSKRVGPVAAALLLAATLCGCSSVVDNIPASVGGLPEGVPQRPATQAVYPAVHDIPPPRQDNALTAAESKQLREDLKNTRNRVAPTEATGSNGGNAGSARNP